MQAVAQQQQLDALDVTAHLHKVQKVDPLLGIDNKISSSSSEDGCLTITLQSSLLEVQHKCASVRTCSMESGSHNSGIGCLSQRYVSAG